MKDFDEIHTLLKEGYPKDAISNLINKEEIAAPYRYDLNHAWYLVGSAHYNLESFEKALIAFKKALLFDSRDYDAMFAIGNCYIDLELPYRAFSFFRKIYYQTENYDALYNLANCYSLAQKNIIHAKKAC